MTSLPILAIFGHPQPLRNIAIGILWRWSYGAIFINFGCPQPLASLTNLLCLWKIETYEWPCSSSAERSPSISKISWKLCVIVGLISYNQEVLFEKKYKGGSEILLWLMVDSWLMIFSSKSWAIRLSDSHTTILRKCLVSMLLSEFPLRLLCISLFFGCLWGNRQHLFSLWRLIRSHYNDLYAFFSDEPFREKSLSEQKSELHWFSWYWVICRERKTRKTLLQAQRTQGIEYFDSFNTFSSKQKLQQALESWSNLSLLFWQRAKSI